jgi:heme exporter protein C
MITKYAKPGQFLNLINACLPWLHIVTALMLSYGLFAAFLRSPADYQQGEMVRIMYIHVPAAWMSMLIYSLMALSSLCFLIWRHALCDIFARCAAQIGATFTFITLVTGSLWGKPIWGTWWVWDARLTSMLILLFFYLGYIMLTNSIENHEKRALSASILALIGFINVPIVKFSVDFWNTLHQPASILRLKGPSIHQAMLQPLIYMFLGCLSYFILVLFLKMKTTLLSQKLSRLEKQY